MSEGLSKRQERFAREYVIDCNGTKAAIRAGYSESGASVQAVRLLADDNVLALVERLTNRKFAKLEISADHVLHELARLAFLDPRKFFDGDGNLKPIHELDDDTAAALAGLEVTEEFTGSGESRALSGYLKKIKIADKGINLERLGKHLRLFGNELEAQNNVQININVTLPRPTDDVQ